MVTALLLAALLPATVAIRLRPEGQETEGLLPWAAARQRAAAALQELSADEKASLARGAQSLVLKRLGVPALNVKDQVQNGAGLWPSGMALAATWDRELVESVGAAMGRELRGQGTNAVVGPAVSVSRYHNGGHNIEQICGEDPALGQGLVPAFIRGVQSQGVVSIAKFYSPSEEGIDERARWEMDYPVIEAAIKAGVGGFMCARGRANGTQACRENHGFLEHDLKKAIGFEGFMVSRWGAAQRGQSPAVELSSIDAEADEVTLNDAAMRMLSTIYHLRLDEHSEEKLSDAAKSELKAIARKAAINSAVLLKNDQFLPLDRYRFRSVAIVGPAAYVRPHEGAPTVAETLSEQAAAHGMKVLLNNSTDPAKALPTVLEADATLLVVSAMGTQGVDRTNMQLDPGHDAFIGGMWRKDKPVAILCMLQGAVAMPWHTAHQAVISVFSTGEEAGHAFAAVAFGDHNPDGRLPVSFPLVARELPEEIFHTADGLTYKTFAVPASFEEQLYLPGPGMASGLYTPFRQQRQAFNFGHGMSYTSFNYGVPRNVTDSCPEYRCLEVNVTNMGTARGREVVQAYFKFPPAAQEPARVLRGFHKTGVLRPMQSEKVTMAFTERDLSSYGKNGWVLHDDIQVSLGPSPDVIYRRVMFQI